MSDEEKKDENYKLTINDELFECLFYDKEMGILKSVHQMLILALPEIKQFLQDRIQKNPKITYFQDKNASVEAKDRPYFIEKIKSENNGKLIHRIKINNEKTSYQGIYSKNTVYTIWTNEDDFNIECDSSHEKIEDVLKDCFFAVLESYESRYINSFSRREVEKILE